MKICGHWTHDGLPPATCHLPAEELAELRAAHRGTRDKHKADRIKAVVLLANDWGTDDVSDALLVDSNTVRNHFNAYRGGLRAGGRLADPVGDPPLSGAKNVRVGWACAMPI